MNNRTLFFGDNLKIVEEKIPDDTFDLIYLDPPFNSNRNYNVLFKEGQIDASAQIHAFEDTWEWTPTTVKLLEELKQNDNPQIVILISSLYEFIHDTPMMAYLVNMTARLIPLHRVLKETGSIYLHCDPTASHYLKILLDVIFGTKNYRNEIIWSYKTGGTSKSTFAKKHDVIFFYTKSDKYKFNTQYYRSYQQKKYNYSDKYPEYFDSEKQMWYHNAICRDVWDDIYVIGTENKERMGYPTQKPEALLERILKSSSNEGDIVLDPFCGCGTTVAVAERLKRNWVGIDISMLAIKVIEKRMNDHYNGIKITIDGIPMDFESAQKLAENDKFAFQDWAISLIGAHPPSGETRRGADRGVDGLILFYDRGNLKDPKLKKIIVQVKGGNTNHRVDVATLKGDIDRDDAPMGILITLNQPTSEMKREASLAGEYKYSDSTSFPKIQLLSIHEWFSGKSVKLPSDKVDPFKRAEARADQTILL